MATTTHGFVVPDNDLVPAALYPIVVNLAQSVDDWATSVVDPLTTPNSDQKILSSTASPNSTSNINLTSLNMSVTVASTLDVVWVEIDATVVITTAGTVNTVELLVDGVADGMILTTSMSGTGRTAGHKKWRLTGLSAGAHTLAFRTRNSASSTGADVSSTLTAASYRVDFAA